MKNKKLPFAQTLSIGALAGMRTSAGPLIASQLLCMTHSDNLEGSPFNFMQSKTTARILVAMAIGEIIVDKLPFTPNRIKAGGVAGRCLAGAFAGACLYKASGGKAAAGAFVGATAAGVATFASFFLRKCIVKKSNIFDPIIGGIEDALVIGAGVELCRM